MRAQPGLSGFVASAATALWGLALAISLMPALQDPAPAGALPGAMTKAGLDPAGPLRQVSLLLLLTLLGAGAGSLLWQRVPALSRWSHLTALIALATAPLSVMAGGGVLHVVAHAAFAAAAVAARNVRASFSRADVILIPAILVVYFALLDLLPRALPVTMLIAGIALVFALRLVIAAFRPGILPKLRSRAVATVVYPLFITIYPLALLGFASPTLDFFEDGHELLPAAEMLRGEKPYADIVPVHSLLADGGMAWAVMKSGHENAGDVLRARRAVSALNLTAIYFVALAATASGEAALLAALMAICLYPPATIWVRSIGALFALAAAVAAVRTQRPRYFGVAGALLVVGFLFGMEFAVYSAIATMVALTRMREKVRATAALAIGIAAASVPLAIVAAAAGFAGPMFRVTLFELLPAGTQYVPGPLTSPDSLRSFSALIAGMGRRETMIVLLYFAAVVISFAMLMRRRSRSDGAWIIGAWIAVAAISFAQRRHLYFAFAIAPFAVAALLHLRRRNGRLFVTLAVIAGIAAMPLAHVFDVATPLRRSGGVVPGQVPVAGPRGGVLAPPHINAAIGSARKFAAQHLQPHETWFDFTNAPSLYYFLERDCPIRHHQVVFYQPDRLQREVIATLERNRNVRAALLQFPGAMSAIDGVPNRERAPLVAQYLEQNFRPAFAENDVVFWIRYR